MAAVFPEGISHDELTLGVGRGVVCVHGHTQVGSIFCQRRNHISEASAVIKLPHRGVDTKS